MLQRLFLDSRLRVVEFILELLSIGGRLPNFELISASLRSNNPKERGNAIETIEQGIDQKLFQTLVPLIDERSLEERVAFFEQHFQRPPITPDSIIDDALNSGFPTGSMVAAQALWELDAEASIDRLRARIRDDDTPALRSVILSLMGVEVHGLNLVERIHRLMRTPLFESFGVVGLETIAERATEVSFAGKESIYKSTAAAGELFYLINGTVKTAGEVINPGEVFGEGCLFAETRADDAVAESQVNALRISKAAVFQNVDVYPETAVHLLEFSSRATS